MESVEEIDYSDVLAEDDSFRREPDGAAQTADVQDEWEPASATAAVDETPKGDGVKRAEKLQEATTEEPKMLTAKQKEKLRKKEKYRNMPKSKSHGQVSFTILNRLNAVYVGNTHSLAAKTYRFRGIIYRSARYP